MEEEKPMSCYGSIRQECAELRSTTFVPYKPEGHSNWTLRNNEALFVVISSNQARMCFYGKNESRLDMDIGS